MQRATTLSFLALTVGTRAAEQASAATTSAALGVVATESNAGGGGNGREGRETRPFFIQDPTDGLCLSGSTFKRCAVDTLWRVEGEPGQLSVRHMAVQEDGEAWNASSRHRRIERKLCALCSQLNPHAFHAFGPSQVNTSGFSGLASDVPSVVLEFVDPSNLYVEHEALLRYGHALYISACIRDVGKPLTGLRVSTA